LKTLGIVWRTLVGIKDFLVLCLLALFFISLSVLLSAGKPAAGVPDGGALVVALQGAIVDQASEVSPLEAFSGGGLMEVQARDVIRALNRARDDKRIKLIVLDLDGFAGAGPANITAIASAIAQVRAAGKPVHAYATAYGDDAWALAAAATRIWVSPLGGVVVAGPGGSNLYFGRALDKLQIDVNVFRVGTYKSFVEPYTRASASPEAKAADQVLADSLWNNWLAEAKLRRPQAQVAAYVAQLPQRLGAAGGDGAKAALAAGLVDRIASRDAFEAAMIEAAGEGDIQEWGAWRGVGLPQYLAATQGRARSSGDAVGVVYVSGNIVDGEAPRGTAGSATIRAALREALDNDGDIKALVVRVDSGGGSVTASEEIRAALLAAKSDGLPVVASFGPVAASGGYWVATAADEIFAQPDTITGSIGVFAILPSFPRALNEIGINADGVKTTPYSGEPDVAAGLSPQVRAVLQMGVEDIYRRFLGVVGEARKLPAAEVDRIAQGRVWSGTDAKRLKLIDNFGDLDAAVAAAAKRAGIEGDVRVVDIEKPEPPWVTALKGFGSAETAGIQARDVWAMAVQASRLRMLAAAQDLAFLASGRGATMQAACVECAVAGSPRPAAARTAETWAARLIQSSR
jgi:protease IV